MKKVLSILVLLMTFMVSGYAQDTYTVAGAVLGGTGSEDAGFFGTKWDATNTANDMAVAEGGVFVKKYENLDLSVCQIAFKVATNHAWSKDGSTDYPSSNYVLMVSKAGKYDLTITFNPDGKKVDALLESKDSAPEINSMEIRGNFPGMSWNDDGAVAMTQVAGSTSQWRAVMENVVVEGKTYEYKAFANHATDGYQLPANGNKEFAFGTELYPAGTYNLTFTVDTQKHSLDLAAQKVEDPEPTITSMEIRGTFPGMSWDEDGAVAMIKSTETAWMVTVEDVVVEAKTYEYKAFANHETTGFQLPAEGNASFEFGTEQHPAGKYNLRFIADTKWKRFECVPMAPTHPAIEPEPETQTFTATFKNSIGWENVYAYAWSGDGESVVKFNGDFPGVQLKKDETTGIYQYSVEAVKAPEKIIFSNGLKGEALQQTEDLVFENGKEYDMEASTPETPTITKVQICGATDAVWENRIDFELKSAAPEQPDTYYNILDATEYTDDVEFKLVINEKEWLGIGRLEKIEAPEGLIDQTTNVGEGKSYNFILKNSNGEYKTYGFKATWKENPDAGAGWSLSIQGIDKREATPEPATPEFIVLGNNAEIFGAAWDQTSTTNTMEFKDGKYYRQYNNVKPQEKDIELKVYNKTNDTWFGKGKDNVVFNMKAEGSFTVVLDVNADFTEGNVWVEGENVVVPTEPEPEPEPTEPVYYAVGTKNLWGTEWAIDDANKLTLNDEGKYTITKTGLTLDANTNYGYKVVKKVGDTQTWIPDGMGNEKNLTVSERAVYSVTLTLDPAEPVTADSYVAVATKTGEAEPAGDAEITSVQMPGDWNWALEKGEDGVEPYLVLKKGENNTWTGVLDLTEVTKDQEFKLNINKSQDNWLGWGELELAAPENWTDKQDGDGNNIVLKNSSTGYKTYNVTATWEASPNAKAGWTLTIAGKDERPVVTEPVYTLVGAFYDVEGNLVDKESASIFGEPWKVLEANNLDKIYEGFYKKEYTGIKLMKGSVSLKVLKDGDWDHAYPNKDGYKLEISSAGIYDLTFTFHSEDGVVRGEAVKKSDIVEIKRMDIVGDFTGGWPVQGGDGSFDWSVAKAMTQDASNPDIWTLKIEGFKAEAKTYEYKAAANGSWDGGYNLPAEGNNNWVFGSDEYPAGKYDLLFTANTADNTLTLVPTLKEVEVVILAEEKTLGKNETLEIDKAFTGGGGEGDGEVEVEEGTIVVIEAHEYIVSARNRTSRALADDDITIQYKPTAESDWTNAGVAVKATETGYEFELNNDLATAINERGFAIKANKPIVVTAISVVTEVTEPTPAPEANYYIVGSMTNWQTKEAYKLTVNEAAEAGVVEYMITIDLAKDDQFKIAKSDDGIHVDDADWYPTGMENNYKITKTSNYTIYFRPNYDGGEGWHYGCIYAVDNNPTAIRMIGADLPKDAAIFDLYGRRITNPAKGGVYIVNGKKVVVK